MIRCIAAIDGKRGLANEVNIPWLGQIPSDTQYYRNKLRNGLILMGYGTYLVLPKPYHHRINYVATQNHEKLRPGFEAVSDARKFLIEAAEDVWNVGGAGLFASTLDLAEELYLTELEGDFNCTKFFPVFKDRFELVKKGEPLTENGITFRFNVYRRTNTAPARGL